MSAQAMTIGGCVVLEEFATSDRCTELLMRVNDYRASHTIPMIERINGELPLKYSVIDGERIAEDLPDVSKIYERVTRLVEKLWRGAIEPLADAKVACNINITQPGGSYRYHYDRNALTAILYLNATRGGETECYPNYRLALRGHSPHGRSIARVAAWAPSHAQLLVDRVLQNRFVRGVAARQLLVRPRPGRLLIM